MTSYPVVRHLFGEKAYKEKGSHFVSGTLLFERLLETISSFHHYNHVRHDPILY